MRILHICSYYIGNKLYMNLVKQLSFKGIDQEVFIPIKDKKYFGKNQLSPEFNSVNYYYRNILKKHDKILFYNKINKQMRCIEDSIINKKNIDFIHAHTLFSDGGTAYRLNKKYGINYLITVRNTDINVFYKYAIHLRPLMYKILLNAAAIVCISHAYKQKMISILPQNVLKKVEGKFQVIPNGIDDYWHENSIERKTFNKLNEVKLLFIGHIDKNKNLETVIRTCARLRDNGYDASLHVVGSGPFENRCKKLSQNVGIRDNIIFYGYINNKDKIASIMDVCDVFILPSFKETFGLVYIEAMSRGLPIIYTKGEGIDGFFCEGEVGFSVQPNKTNEITEQIIKIISNINRISLNCIERSTAFNWSLIAEKYFELYNLNI